MFGTASIFVMYMIPAIWLGNFALIYLFKKLYVEKKINYVGVSIVAVVAKAAAIFAGFNLLVFASVIPSGTPVAEALFAAMGINQLITASIGAIVAYGVLKMVYSRK